MPSAPDAPTCRLYLITPPEIAELPAFVRALESALSGGDVAAVQVRLKGVTDAQVADAVRSLGPVVRAADAALILNDRPDLAAALDCDGVHIGQEDAPYAEARRLMGHDRTVGVTCHDSLHLAFEAAEAGADYVAFGAFFPTSTKAAPTRAEPELLTGWQSHMPTPCVAIGGVTVANARSLAQAGADFLAASAGVWSFPQGPRRSRLAIHIEIAAGLAARVGS